MKTPEEIKRGLEHCCPDLSCDGCPYEIGNRFECINHVLRDALAYIQKLERERDAAVKDCARVPCKTCKKNTKDGFCHTCSLIDGCCTGHVWRGVKEV